MQVGPGTKDYGALSLAVQYYSKPEIVATVSPSCFIPQPKVGSAVIKLSKYDKPPIEVCDDKLLFKVIKAAFNQRRKTLVNALKNSGEINVNREQIEEILNDMNLSLTVRGETLTLDEFAILTNKIKMYTK